MRETGSWGEGRGVDASWVSRRKRGKRGRSQSQRGTPPRRPDLFPLGHKANAVEIGIREQREGIRYLPSFSS